MSFASWDALKSSFTSRYETLRAAAVDKAEALVRDRADDARAVVAGFLHRLVVANGLLAAVGGLLPTLPDDPTSRALRQRYAEMELLTAHLLDGFRREVVPQGDEVGVVPVVVIVVGGIGVTLAGVILAVAAYTYAQGLEEQSRALLAETEARVAYAKRTGTDPGAEVARASAPPPPAPPDDKKGGWGWLLVAAGLVAGAAFVLPKLGKG